MFPEIDFKLILDIGLIAIPILIVLFFVIKYVIPKKPALGIGLAIGGGLLGAWLIKRRLQSAHDAEEELALHNKMMAAFKDKQDKRAQAVLVNKEVIATLQDQRTKLAKNAAKHETELALIDKELEERKKLNEKILSDTDAFVDSTKKRSSERKNLLDRFIAEGGTVTADAPQAVVEKEQRKKTDAESRIKVLEEQIKGLKNW